MKNKKIIAFLVFFLLLFSLQVSAKEKIYNEKDLYSFTVPENWEQIPKGAMYEVIKGSEDAFEGEEEGVDYVQYKVAFQRKHEQYFRYPFVFVKYKKTTMEGTTEELKAFSSNINKVKMVKEYEKTGIKISNLKVGYLKVDEEKNTILTISNGTVGTKQMAFTTMMFLEKGKIIQMDFFTFQENYEEVKSEMETFMNSFSFEKLKENEVKAPAKEEPKKEEKPKEEKPKEEKPKTEEPKKELVAPTPVENPSSAMNLVWGILVVVLLIFGVVGWVLWRKWKQKKEEKLMQQGDLFLYDDEEEESYKERAWYDEYDDEEEEARNNVEGYGSSENEEDVYKYGNRYYKRNGDEDEDEDYGFNDYYRRDEE